MRTARPEGTTDRRTYGRATDKEVELSSDTLVLHTRCDAERVHAQELETDGLVAGRLRAQGRNWCWQKEFSCGLTFVASSRVRKLSDLLFSPPFPYQRLSCLANIQRLHDRQMEDIRLSTLQP